LARRSAIDVISPALEHTKRQLLPWNWSQWWRLAVLGLATGELSSGGSCNGGNFNFPSTGGGHGKSQEFLGNLPWWQGQDAATLALAIGVGLLVLCILILLFMYVSSVCRFVLIETVVKKRCDGIRAGWVKWRAAGRKYFLWLLVYQLALGVFAVVLIGIPVGIALLAGWLTNPREHLAPLIAGGIVLFFVLMAFLLAAAVVHVFGKDFMAPVMALENLDFADAWSRLLAMMKTDKGGYAGYLGMKIVLAIAAGVVFAIIFVVLLIPVVIAVVALVLGLKGAGVPWNAATIAAAIVAGAIAFILLMAVIALVSVPLAVFFPAYGIYFFASRYPALDAWLNPPPAPVAPSPVVLPPLPPPIAPEPIG
jgi:hypothetical protein